MHVAAQLGEAPAIIRGKKTMEGSVAGLEHRRTLPNVSPCNCSRDERPDPDSRVQSCNPDKSAESTVMRYDVVVVSLWPSVSVSGEPCGRATRDLEKAGCSDEEDAWQNRGVVAPGGHRTLRQEGNS